MIPDELHALLREIVEAGVKVSEKSGELVIRARKGTDAALLVRIKQQKADLLRVVTPLRDSSSLLNAVQRVFGPCQTVGDEQTEAEADGTDAPVRKWLEYAETLLAKRTARGGALFTASEVDAALIGLQRFALRPRVAKMIGTLTEARRKAATRQQLIARTLAGKKRNERGSKVQKLPEK